MMSRYFQMTDDLHVPGRWYLTDPIDHHGKELGRTLLEGKRLAFERPVVVQFNKFAERGRPIDYCELDAVGGSVPVVHIRVAAALSELAPQDVQIIPVQIDGQLEQFCILNVTRIIQCIDDRASRHVERYTEADGELFADQVGEYTSVRGMRISRSNLGDAKIFRTWGWGSIIVAEEIKQALEQIKTVGVRFQEV